MYVILDFSKFELKGRVQDNLWDCGKWMFVHKLYLILWLKKQVPSSGTFQLEMMIANTQLKLKQLKMKFQLAASVWEQQMQLNPNLQFNYV